MSLPKIDLQILLIESFLFYTQMVLCLQHFTGICVQCVPARFLLSNPTLRHTVMNNVATEMSILVFQNLVLDIQRFSSFLVYLVEPAEICLVDTII